MSRNSVPLPVSGRGATFLGGTLMAADPVIPPLDEIFSRIVSVVRASYDAGLPATGA